MQRRDRVRPLVLVLTDSLAFVGPRHPHPVDDRRLWPNVMGAELDVDVEVFGDFGWTARDAWYALSHNPCLWPVLNDIDAVVLAVGSYDSAPAPLPTYLWKRIPMIRSATIRRFASRTHRKAIPLLTRFFALLPGTGPVVLRPRLSAHFLQASCTLLRQARQDVPVIGITPMVSVAKLYAGLHKGRPKAERAIREWARSADIPLLDLSAVVGDHMRSEQCNPDQLHMGWGGHTALGMAAAGLVGGMLPAEPSQAPSPTPDAVA